MERTKDNAWEEKVESRIEEIMALRQTADGRKETGGWFYGNWYREGALWQRNSVWHDVSEKPQNNKECLVKTYPNDAYMVMTSNSEHFRLVKMWAYIDDLLPTE